MVYRSKISKKLSGVLKCLLLGHAWVELFRKGDKVVQECLRCHQCRSTMRRENGSPPFLWVHGNLWMPTGDRLKAPEAPVWPYDAPDDEGCQSEGSEAPGKPSGGPVDESQPRPPVKSGKSDERRATRRARKRTRASRTGRGPDDSSREGRRRR